MTYATFLYKGYSDLPSRLPTQSSTLYANNISKFLLSIGEKGHYNINLEDEVVRGSIILHEVNEYFTLSLTDCTHRGNLHRS